MIRLVTCDNRPVNVAFIGGPLHGQTRASDRPPTPLRVLDRVEQGCPMPEHVYVLYEPQRRGGGWAMVAQDTP